MDKLDKYRNLVVQMLENHYRPVAVTDEIEMQILIDRQHDHYQLLHVGWRDGEHPVYGCVVHVDIKNGKIWIQRDFTEDGVALELMEAGVPKEDIVLAFQSPYKRQFTDFAVA